MKRLIRAIGFDDAAFSKKDERCLLVGVVCRPDGCVEGAVSTSAEVDGKDACTRIAHSVNSSRFRQQLRAIFLQGFTVAGFNMIDLQSLARRTRLPVISILRKRPGTRDVDRALRHLKDYRAKLELFNKNNKYNLSGSVLVNCAGITFEEACKLARHFTVRGNVPEPLRLAHIFASGVSLGESSKNK